MSNDKHMVSASNDMRVIDSLDVSKRPVQLSNDLGMSPNTVKQILNRLRRDDVIERCGPRGFYRLTEL